MLDWDNGEISIQGSHRNSKTKFHDFSMIKYVISMII